MPFPDPSRSEFSWRKLAGPLLGGLVLLAGLGAVALDWTYQSDRAETTLARQMALRTAEVSERIRRDVRETTVAMRALAVAAELDHGLASLRGRGDALDLAVPLDSVAAFDIHPDSPQPRGMRVLRVQGGAATASARTELESLSRDAARQAAEKRRVAMLGPSMLQGERVLALGVPEIQAGRSVVMVAVFRMDPWLQDVMRSQGDDYALQIEDARPNGGARLLWGEQGACADAVQRNKALYADTTAPWRIALCARESALEIGNEERWARALLGAGLCMVLGLLVGFLVERRRWAEAWATQATEALRDSEQRLERALTVTEDGVFEYDTAQRTLYCSQRMIELLGGRQVQARGHDSLSLRNLLRGLSARHRQRVIAAIREALGSGAAIDEEVRLQSPGGHADRWLRLRARVGLVQTGTTDATGQARLLSGAVSDVTTQVEAALTSERYQSFLVRVMDALPVPVSVKDASHRVVAANAAYCRVMRRDVSRLIGCRVSEFMPMALATRLEALDDRALASGQTQTSSEWLERAGEPPTFLRVSKRVCEDADGFAVVVSCFEDLTQLQEREDREIRTREFLQAIFDALPHPLFVKDEDHRYVMTNRAHALSVGRQAEDVIGQNAHAFAVRETALAIEQAENEMFSRDSREIVEHEYTLHDPQGQAHQVMVRKALCRDPSGRRVLIGINTDITSLRDMERELRSALQRFASLVADAPLGIATLDMSGRFTQVNPALCQMLGYSEQEMQTLTAAGITPARDAEAHDAQRRALQEHGRSEACEQHYISRDGRELPVLVSAVLVDQGGPADAQAGIWMLVQDLSERNASHEALRESEARWQFALEGAGDGVWDWNVASGAHYVGPRWLRQLGYADGAIDARMDAWQALIHPDDLENTIEAARAHVSGMAPVYISEYRLRCADGSYRWMLDRGKVMQRDLNDRALRVIGTRTDITERKAVEQELVRHRDQLAAISRLQEQFIRAPDSKIAFEKLLESLLQFTGSEYGFVGEVFRDERDQPFLKTQAILDVSWDAAARRFFEMHAPGGMEFHGLDTLFGVVLKNREMLISNDPANDPRSGGTPVGHPPLRSFLGVPVMLGDEMVGMVGLANRPGGYNEGVAQELQPLLATYGKMIHAVHNERARQKAEHALTQHHDQLKELVQAQTGGLLRAKEAAERASEAKSLFLANMSHELRTPMHAVLSFARLGEEKSERAAPERVRDYFGRIRTAGERLMNLLNDLLDLSKLEAGRMLIDMRVVDLHRVIDEVLHEYEAWLAAKKLRIVRDVDMLDGSACVQGDAGRIGQVLRNLLSNAVKFSPEGACIRIALATAIMPAGRRASDVGERPAVELAVADEGMGIPPEELDTIFDKFVQSSKTKTGAGGTGLGLAICREIVMAHRGQIHARNRDTGGAEFVVRLLAEDASLPVQAEIKERG